MTGFLASVSSLEEARIVHAAGVDVIDLKDPARGALGAVEPAVARMVAAALVPQEGAAEDSPSAPVLSAATGDLPVYAAELEAAIARMHALGPALIKVGVADPALSRFTLKALARLADKNIPVILVFYAESYPGAVDFHRLAEAGVKGVMLDTREKASGNLRRKLAPGVLARFVASSQGAGLIAGLAGSLGPEDIAPLLPLAPDYLGFRGALCEQGRREACLTAARVAALRKLIPPIRTARALQETGAQQPSSC